MSCEAADVSAVAAPPQWCGGAVHAAYDTCVSNAIQLASHPLHEAMELGSALWSLTAEASAWQMCLLSVLAVVTVRQYFRWVMWTGLAAAFLAGQLIFVAWQMAMIALSVLCVSLLNIASKVWYVLESTSRWYRGGSISRRVALRRTLQAAGAPCASLSYRERLQLFERASVCIGHTALCLSGGGSLAMYHLGVALIEAGTMPRIVSGTSGGAIVAGVLAEMLSDIIQRDIAVRYLPDRWFPPLPQLLYNSVVLGSLVDSTVLGSLVDNDVFARCTRRYYGDTTFEEAYRKTGRVVNINISSSSQASEELSTTLSSHYSGRSMSCEAADVSAVAAPPQWCGGAVHAAYDTCVSNAIQLASHPLHEAMELGSALWSLTAEASAWQMCLLSVLAVVTVRQYFRWVMWTGLAAAFLAGQLIFVAWQMAMIALSVLCVSLLNIASKVWYVLESTSRWYRGGSISRRVALRRTLQAAGPRAAGPWVEWAAAARELDSLDGKDAWRAEPPPNCDRIGAATTQLKSARESNDLQALALMRLLSSMLVRDYEQTNSLALHTESRPGGQSSGDEALRAALRRVRRLEGASLAASVGSPSTPAAVARAWKVTLHHEHRKSVGKEPGRRKSWSKKNGPARAIKTDADAEAREATAQQQERADGLSAALKTISAAANEAAGYGGGSGGLAGCARLPRRPLASSFFTDLVVRAGAGRRDSTTAAPRPHPPVGGGAAVSKRRVDGGAG
ncbi:hypothetical protein EMIHUDRAFT_462347 [Emiliania huxleyi CCMP1516]|uniref:PNPLA domain-containing protein n=2 Tax=Emiliania huxleyi TaxID=2903 RepID=A0A0D3KLZ9_EMIH1|nr:hypothetical protein EMIHUDRAFT_462347 [Emiliania huxleyi CCMP1516]EOD36784.1 hypothetical protein EMIHUDRAFT_462347 [Emiliania huxleyi CCMP1516]|eukprot:XP_005789213.1 hypothetical protein EMIHUDRAFT_462347 [Emiliania huxleyi CCMP1516]